MKITISLVTDVGHVIETSRQVSEDQLRSAYCPRETLEFELNITMRIFKALALQWADTYK